MSTFPASVPEKTMTIEVASSFIRRNKFSAGPQFYFHAAISPRPAAPQTTVVESGKPANFFRTRLTGYLRPRLPHGEIAKPRLSKP